MDRLTESETDTFSEVNKALNVIIDKLNENEAKDDVYNSEVDKYNESVEESNKKGGK